MAINKLQPVGLTDRVALLAGQIVQVDAGRMSSPAREPMLIDGLRFIINRPVASAQPVDPLGGGSLGCGGAVLAKIELDRFPITEDFVPIWNFDEVGTMWAQALTANQFSADTIDNSSAYYRFRFPEPLLMLPGTSFNIKLQRRLAPDPWSALAAPNDPIHVDVAALGHVVSGARPAFINVPYVNAFVGAYTAAASNLTQTHRSAEQQLKNNIGRTIHIAKLTGRFGWFVRGPPVDGEGDAPSGRLRTLKITSSDFGVDPVGRPTPFDAVFPTTKRAFPFRRDLSPRERLIAEVVCPADGTNTVGDFAPFISFVGWREESV